MYLHTFLETGMTTPTTSQGNALLRSKLMHSKTTDNNMGKRVSKVGMNLHQDLVNEVEDEDDLTP